MSGAGGAGAREFGIDAPMGVQGGGKSLLAKPIAAAWQFPLLRFDIGKVYGDIVGRSEANIRSALLGARALAPRALWIDEIEKGLAGMGSSDQTHGDTSARRGGTLLTWMREKKDPLFVGATANRINMLPAALPRKGASTRSSSRTSPRAPSARRCCPSTSRRSDVSPWTSPSRTSPRARWALRESP